MHAFPERPSKPNRQLLVAQHATRHLHKRRVGHTHVRAVVISLLNQLAPAERTVVTGGSGVDCSSLP